MRHGLAKLIFGKLNTGCELAVRNERSTQPRETASVVSSNDPYMYARVSILRLLRFHILTKLMLWAGIRGPVLIKSFTLSGFEKAES